MKLLLLHLSDLHIRSNEDPILSRASRIAEAVQNLELELDAAVIAVSGDLAFAGKAEQYAAAWELLRSLSQRLQDGLSSRERGTPVPIYVLAVPGNHDCDFDEAGVIRGLLPQQILQNADLARDTEVVRTCTQVQNAFFDYLEIHSTPNSLPMSARYDRRLAYQYEIPVGDQTARFLCLNTAWLSERHENQGRLFFPPEAVEPDGHADVVVAMFHHPYNWNEADDGRAFRAQVEGIADIILTGHEHDAIIRSQQLSTGERNTYIEGGALQDPEHPDESAFNVLILDLAARKQKMARFECNGDRYTINGILNPAGDAFGLVWEDFQVTRIRRRYRDQFQLAEVTREWMDDPGVNLAHPRCGQLRLSDVFVFPELQETLYNLNKSARTIRADKILELITASPYILLMGDSKSGKTCLAKVLFRHLHQIGYVPVYISGTDRLPFGEHLDAYIVKTFVQQYGESEANAYRQLDRSQRVIIVDDLDRLKRNPKERRQIIERLEAFAGRVIILANTLNFELTELQNPERTSDIVATLSVYKLRTLGPSRRSELIDKWLALGNELTTDPVATAHRHMYLMRTVDELIRNNMVPAYPFAVLTVLLANEADTPAATQISTHGAAYELLIRIAMAQGRTPPEWDADLNYLGHFAYGLFAARRVEIDKTEFLRMHQEFEVRFDLRINMSALLENLKKCNILDLSGNTVRFRYPYIYYYFVAYWLVAHLTEQQVRSEITKLISALHIEEFANILMFLLHLCKDPSIIDELLTAADMQYSQKALAALFHDVNFLYTLGMPRERVEYKQKDLVETRNHYLAIQDEIEARSDADENEAPYQEVADGAAHAVDFINEFNTAFKTVDILGQVLKNFPGSLEGGRKLTIASVCCSLGLRALTSVLELINENQPQAINNYKAAIKEYLKQVTDAESEAMAKGWLFLIAEVMAFGVVSRISYAIGSAELRPTYARLVEEINIPSVRLIDLSLKLDHFEFPEAAVAALARDFRQGSFARLILQDLIINHFDLFPVKSDVMRKACASLGIQFSPSRSSLLLPG